MKLFLISDIHGNDNFDSIKDKIAQADLVLCAGDFTMFLPTGEGLRVAEKLAALNPATYMVCGNCDTPDLDGILAGKGLSVQGRSVAFSKGSERYVLAGIGGSLHTPRPTPNTWSENDLVEVLHSFQETPDIIISHQPPYGAGDTVMKTLHVGSKKLTEYLRKSSPVLCLSGHIHEAAGIFKVGQTTVVNPGSWREGHYAVAEMSGKSCTITLY